MSEEQARDADLGLEVSKGFIARVAGAGFGFAGTIVFARLLGPTDFGGFYLLLSLVSLSQRPLLGLNAAAQKRFAEADSPRRQLVGLQVLSNLGVAVVLGLLLVALRGRLVAYTGLDGSLPFFLLLFAAIATFSTFQSFLSAVGRVGLQSWIDSVRSVTTLAGQLALVLAGYGAAGMTFGLVGGTVALVPVTHYYLRTLPAVPSLDVVRSVWSFARYSVPSSVLGKAYDRFDILLLGFLATQAAAGQYEVAYKLTMPAMFIAGVIQSGLGAKVSDFDSRGEEPQRDIVNGLSFVSVVAIPLFFGAVAIAQPVVVTLYGPEYASAAALLVGLTLYRVVQTQADLLTNIVSALDYPEWDFRAGAVALGVNVPLGVALFEAIGAVGVVVATVVAELVRYAVLLYAVSPRVSATLIQRALLGQVVAGVLMLVAVDRAHALFRVNSWIDLVALVGLGATVYAVTLVAASARLRGVIRGVVDRSSLRRPY